MSCSSKVYDCIGDGLKWGLSQGGEALANGAVETFAKAIGEAAGQVLKALNGVWMDVSVGDPESAAGRIASETDWIVGYVAVASLLVAAIRMAIDRRSQSMRQAFNGMWRVLLVGAVATTGVKLLNNASDATERTESPMTTAAETAVAAAGPTDPVAAQVPAEPPFILYLHGEDYAEEMRRLASWVTGLLLPVYGREVASQQPWCPRWWEHPEAVARLHALWLAWQEFTDPAAGASGPAAWHRDHLGPALAEVRSPAGPFAGCRPGGHRAKAAPVTEPYPY